MGGYTSTRSEHLNKKQLEYIPYAGFVSLGFDILVFESNYERSEAVRILESHLETHPDGRMNREEFCDLYSCLKKDPNILDLSEQVFKAHSVITLKEFLLIFATTNKADTTKKLKHVVEQYDVNSRIEYAVFFFFKTNTLVIQDICAKDLRAFLSITVSRSFS